MKCAYCWATLPTPRPIRHEAVCQSCIDDLHEPDMTRLRRFIAWWSDLRTRNWLTDNLRGH